MKPQIEVGTRVRSLTEMWTPKGAEGTIKTLDVTSPYFMCEFGGRIVWFCPEEIGVLIEIIDEGTPLWQNEFELE